MAKQATTKKSAKRKKSEAPIRETDLYHPVRDYLSANGYEVRGEVHHCDLVARKDGDVIVVELKRLATLELLVQATDRQRLSDSVYVAIPASVAGGRSKRWLGFKRLLRQLELGLILVYIESPVPRAEVVFHPLPYQRRRRKAARRAVIEEAASRSDDYNVGGSTRAKLVTAYREHAIRIACCLDRFGPLTPRQLRALGTAQKTTAILAANHYGWFQRVARGLYALTTQGRAALETYTALAQQHRAQLETFPPPDARRSS